MKIPLSWLKEYIEITLSPAELEWRLSEAGIEASGLTGQSKWAGVFVGYVETAEKHPNADRLTVCQVRAGNKRLQVVTGAPNVKQGIKSPLAVAGAVLRNGHSDEHEMIALKPGKLRGVESNGMLCSELELGLSEEHEGIMILPDDAPEGVSLEDYLGDPVLELEFTTNKIHAVSVIGVAGEIGAITNQKGHFPVREYTPTGPAARTHLKVEIADPDLCPRYAATVVRGVKVGPSPDWLQKRLKAAGLRPINNIADVSNYVMLEYGQPLHTFDYNKIAGKHIIVRRAVENEKIESLDHIVRVLTADMLVIADEEGPSAIAGVMGGLHSEITTETTDVLIESANFNPRSIRKTAKTLKLRSDASYRFERGIDPALPIPALERAAMLIQEIAGGIIDSETIDVYPAPVKPRTIDFPLSEIKRLLGINIPVEEVIRILKALGFGITTKDPRSLSISIPTSRGDVEGSADLVEEVARITGYEKIPVTLISDELPPQERNDEYEIKEKARDIMVGAGFDEIITPTLVSLEMLNRLYAEENGYADENLLKLINPLSPETTYLRPTLVPSIVESVALNIRQRESVAIFEIGRCTHKNPEGSNSLPGEPWTLSGALAGFREERNPYGTSEKVDFFDAKGVIETLLDHLGLTDYTFTVAAHPSYHPGRCAKVTLKNGKEIGYVGELHPRVAERCDIQNTRVALWEIDLQEIITTLTGKIQRYDQISRYPAIVQDLAVIVPEATQAELVRALIQQTGGKIVRRIQLFDIYRGAQIGEGRKSLAYSITYQANDRTLVEEEIAKIRAKIEGRLKHQFAGELRV